MTKDQCIAFVSAIKETAVFLAKTSGCIRPSIDIIEAYDDAIGDIIEDIPDDPELTPDDPDAPADNDGES
mgnify:CR=1 FL=1